MHSMLRLPLHNTTLKELYSLSSTGAVSFEELVRMDGCENAAETERTFSALGTSVEQIEGSVMSTIGVQCYGQCKLEGSFSITLLIVNTDYVIKCYTGTSTTIILLLSLFIVY